MKKLKKRKGVSIVEAIVAMAVVFIVIFSASTVIQTSSTVIANEQLGIMAINDVSDIVECYKISNGTIVDGKTDFEKNLAFAFENVALNLLSDENSSPVNENGSQTYDVTYTDCPYKITLTVNFSTGLLNCSIAQNNGEKVFYEATYQKGAVV